MGGAPKSQNSFEPRSGEKIIFGGYVLDMVLRKILKMEPLRLTENAFHAFMVEFGCTNF